MLVLFLIRLDVFKNPKWDFIMKQFWQHRWHQHLIIVSFSKKQLQSKCRKYCKQNSSVIGCSDKQLIHCNLIFNTDFEVIKNVNK